MAYRAFEHAYLAEKVEAADDGLAFFHGLINGVIPSLLGWLVIFAIWYAVWMALP